MRSGTVILLTFVISSTYVFTAPLEKRSTDPDNAAEKGTKTSDSKGLSGKFAKFADEYVKPVWLTNKGPKGHRKSGKHKKKNTNGGNKGSTNGNNSRKTKKRPIINNKRRRANRFSLAFVTTLGNAIGDFQEDRNRKDEMKIIMMWNHGDNVQIVLVPSVDALFSNELYKSHFIRQKRAYESPTATSKLKPHKQNSIDSNEDITEMGFYRNSKFDSILKKLDNNKLSGHNENENELWPEVSLEGGNSLFSFENADTEMDKLKLKITGATSDPQNTSDYDTVGNDKIPKSNLKQNELNNKDLNKNIKPLENQNVLNYNKPDDIEIENLSPKINSNTMKNKINPILEKSNDESVSKGDTNVGNNLINTPKQNNVHKTKNKIQPKSDLQLNDFSLESNAASLENSIFNDSQRNRIQNMFNNKKKLEKKIPNITKTSESMEPNDNKKQFSQQNIQENNKPDNIEIENLSPKINSKTFTNKINPILEKPNDEPVLKSGKNVEGNFENIPKQTDVHKTTNKIQPKLDIKLNEINPESEELSINKPFYESVEKNSLQNKINNSRLPNISDALESINTSENKEKSKINSLQKTKNSEGVDEMLRKQSPKIVPNSNLNEINGVPLKLSNVPNLNNNKESSKNFMNFPDLDEMNESINWSSPTPKKNVDDDLNDSNPVITKLTDGNQIFEGIGSTPQVNIPITPTINTNKISDIPLLTKSNLKIPDSKVNLANKNNAKKPNTAVIDDTIMSIPSEDNRSDNSKDKFFFNSFENFSDELGGAILITAGSFSSSKDPTNKNTSKVDNTLQKDVIDSHSSINNDKYLGKSDTLKPKFFETINNDASEEIFNSLILNSDEDLTINNSHGSVKKLSESIDLPTSAQIFGDNINGSNKKLNNDVNNKPNKLQQSNNQIKNIEEKPKSIEMLSLPNDNGLKIIQKPSEDKQHTIDSLDNSKQHIPHVLHSVSSFEDTAVFNPLKKISNELWSTPINEDINLNKNKDKKPNFDKENKNELEIATNEHFSSEQEFQKPDNINMIEKPKHDNPTIAENFNPNTINSKIIMSGLPNNNIKATDNEIQTPANDVFYKNDKPKFSFNQAILNQNLDPFDSLGGESFFNSIVHLQPDGLQNEPKAGNLILNNNQIQKPINSKDTSENVPKTNFKKISSEISNTNLNSVYDKSTNPGNDVKNTIDKPHNLNDFSSNKSFDPLNSLEDKSLISNKKFSDELNNISITGNSFPNKNQSKKDKSYEPKVLPNISTSITLSSEIGEKIPDLLNTNKASTEKGSGKYETPHIFSSIINTSDLLKNNEKHSSLDENNNKFNTKIPDLSTSTSAQYNTEGELNNDNLVPKTFEDMIDEKSDFGKENSLDNSLPSNEAANNSEVLKTELNNLNLDQLSNEPFDKINNTSEKPKSKEISLEILSSSLNTIDSKIQTPFDDNIQHKTDTPNSSDQHISNKIIDVFSSLGDESFFEPIKYLPSNILQNLSKSGNSVPINDQYTKLTTKDSTNDTVFKPKHDKNKLGLSNNDPNLIIDNTNNLSESAQDAILVDLNKSTLPNQSHDPLKSLEDKSFSNEIFSGEQQKVPINEDSFLNNSQNKIPVTSENIIVLHEISTNEPSPSEIKLNKSDISNLSDLSESKVDLIPKTENALNPIVVTSIESNLQLIPLNTADDGVDSQEHVDIMKDTLIKDFAERFIDSKPEVNNEKSSGLNNSIDDTKIKSTEKPNKYLERINKIINNTNNLDTILKPQSQSDKSSNAGEIHNTITFSPNVSNHQYTNILKNPKTDEFSSIFEDELLPKIDNKIVNTEVPDSTTSIHPLNEKSKTTVDLNGKKSHDQLDDLDSNSFKTTYNLLDDNKKGELNESTIGKITPANDGELSYLADKSSNQLVNKESIQMKQNILEKPTVQKMEELTHQIINNYQNSNNIHPIFNNGNGPSDTFTPLIDTTMDNLHKFKSQDYNPYGFMIPKFSTKHEDSSSNDLWESTPPKQNKNNFYRNNELDNFNNILSEKKISNEHHGRNNKISSHDDSNKELNEWNENTNSDNIQNTEVKLNTNNNNNNNEFLNEYLKNMTEKVLNRIDNIDDKIAKLNLLSNSETKVINQEIENKEIDNLTATKLLATNINPISSKNKNESIESDSEPNETVESNRKLFESEDDEGSKIKKHQKTEDKKNKNKKRKKREKYKENNRNNEDTRDKKRKNNENKKDKNRKKPNNNNSFNDSNDVVVDKVHRKHKQNSSSDSDDTSLQHKNSPKKKKRNKIKKEIMYSSEEDSNINYSSSNEITDSYYDSVSELKASDKPKKLKKIKKNSEKKPIHKSYSKHSNYPKDAIKHKTRKISLKDDSNYDKPVTSKKRYVKVHDEDDEIKESKKKKKRKKKKKKEKDSKTIKENDTQAIDNDADDTSNGYEYITFYPEIQYTNPFSRFYM